MSLTADQLEKVAWSLDVISKLALRLLEPIAMMDEIAADRLEVTVELTRGGNPLTPPEARELVEWLVGDEMQEDLRAEARKMVELHKVRPAAPGDMSINERVAWKEGWMEGYLAQPLDMVEITDKMIQPFLDAELEIHERDKFDNLTGISRFVDAYEIRALLEQAFSEVQRTGEEE